MESHPHQEAPERPEFGYDQERAEASVSVPGRGSYYLEQVTLTEPNETLSILSGVDRETGESVTFEVLDDRDTLELIKVTVEGEVVYQPTLH